MGRDRVEALTPAFSGSAGLRLAKIDVRITDSFCAEAALATLVEVYIAAWNIRDGATV